MRFTELRDNREIKREEMSPRDLDTVTSSDSMETDSNGNEILDIKSEIPDDCASFVSAVGE